MLLFLRLVRLLEGGWVEDASEVAEDVEERFSEEAVDDGGGMLEVREAAELEAEDSRCSLAEAALAAARAAARAACVTGTWMPSDGRDRDLRRVLYGMVTL